MSQSGTPAFTQPDTALVPFPAGTHGPVSRLRARPAHARARPLYKLACARHWTAFATPHRCPPPLPRMSARTSFASTLARAASRPGAGRALRMASAGALRPPVAQAAPQAVRSFSSSVAAREYESPFGVNSLNKFTEEEELLRDSVRSFARDLIAPKVEEMDEKELMDPAIIKGLFENGYMGIETDPDYGGAGSSFTSAIIVIEGMRFFCFSFYDGVLTVTLLFPFSRVG